MQGKAAHAEELLRRGCCLSASFAGKGAINGIREQPLGVPPGGKLTAPQEKQEKQEKLTRGSESSPKDTGGRDIGLGWH